jgi:ubiquinone/menaquinone biosynthesis C-methylase UbiE
MIANDAVNDRVDEAQWQVAQSWEREFWLRQQRSLARFGKNYIWRLLSLFRLVEKYRGDDDNRWWAERFDNYRFLPAQVDNMIEVGCGPYTNLRLLRKSCTPRHPVLSDPLIRTYVRFRMTFVREMYLQAGCSLDDSPLEALPYRDSLFDVSLMVNVLDHVRDAHACLETLYRITKPGGFVIIGQDLTNDLDLQSHPDGMRTGHPITLNETWIHHRLEDLYRPVIDQVLPREAGRTPDWHYGTFLFAGVRK